MAMKDNHLNVMQGETMLFIEGATYKMPEELAKFSD
jgi:hypothetical protein